MRRALWTSLTERVCDARITTRYVAETATGPAEETRRFAAPAEAGLRVSAAGTRLYTCDTSKADRSDEENRPALPAPLAAPGEAGARSAMSQQPVRLCNTNAGQVAFVWGVLRKRLRGCFEKSHIHTLVNFTRSPVQSCLIPPASGRVWTRAGPVPQAQQGRPFEWRSAKRTQTRLTMTGSSSIHEGELASLGLLDRVHKFRGGEPVDQLCNRFLVARKGDKKKAISMLRDYLDWAERDGVLGIRRRTAASMLRGDTNPEGKAFHDRTFPHGLLGRCKEGRPVLYQVLS